VSVTAGSRVRVGGAMGGDLAYQVGDGLGLQFGVRAALLDEETTVRVQGSPIAVLPAWETSVAVGLNMRLP